MRTEGNLPPTAEIKTVDTGMSGTTDTRGITDRLTGRTIDPLYRSIMVETTGIRAQHTHLVETMNSIDRLVPTLKEKKASKYRDYGSSFLALDSLTHLH